MSTILIIGAGAIGREHADACASLPNASACRVLVTDANPDALRGFVSAFPQAEAIADIDEALLAKDDDQAIAIVATPPAPRAQLMEQCLRAGWHVLAEKPFTMTVAEADQVVAVAHACDRLVACCDSRFLGQNCLHHIRSLWKSGELGTCYRIIWEHRQSRARSGVEWQPESPWFLQRSVNGGGVLMDWAPYDLATIHALVQPRSVCIERAWMASPEAAMPAGVSPRPIDVEFHAGAHLTYHTDEGFIPVMYERSSCLHGPAGPRFVFEGTQATAELDWTFEPGVEVHRDKTGLPVVEKLPHQDDGLHYHHRPLHHILTAVAGQESAATLGHQARFNLAVLRGLYQAIETQAPVTVTLGEGA